MVPGDRDVCDADLTVVASPDLDFVSLGHVDRVDDLQVLRGHAFEDQIFLFRLFERHYCYFLPCFGLDNIWKLELTQLAIKRFPAIRLHILVLLERALAVEPGLQALDMDAAHAACTLARLD